MPEPTLARVPDTPPSRSTPTRRLADALGSDGARPLVTFYDDATGERIELSVVTFENWVAKTSNLIVDGLGLAPGARVALLLPLHWQTAVWLAACWRTGATAVLGGDPAAQAAAADLAVTGPGTLDAALAADEVVALSLRPMGGRFTDPLPGGVLDYAVEVPGHGDRFAAAGPAPEVTEIEGTVLTGTALDELADAHAKRWGLDDGGRLLTELDPATLDGAVALLPGALARGGSVVLCRNLDDARLEQRTADERVTAVAV